MKTASTIFLLFVAFTLVPQANAHEPGIQSSLRKEVFQPQDKIELYKDPLVATYLSATMPGLGQAYAGSKKRGFLFLTSVLGAFGSAYAFYKPAELDVADYDKTEYGGNGDGLLSIVEAKNWQDRDSESDAFERLNTTRKVGAITSVVAGVGFYIWNILDARRQANNHNRLLAQRRVNLGLQAGPDRAGLALNVHF